MLIRGFSKTICINKTLIILSSIICIFAIISSFSNSYSADQEPHKYKPGQLIIKLKTETMPVNVKNLNKKHDVSEVKQLFKEGKIEKLNKLKKDIGLTRIYMIKVPKSKDIEEIVSEYRQNPDIEYAEPDYIVEGGAMPNDTYFNGNQWNLNNTGQNGGKVDADIDAPEAWDLTTGNNNIVIAIVDTGIKLDHPDLSSKIVAGYDFVNNDDNPSDDHGHGTHVAGIAAAVTNNSTGIAGVCWNCQLMPVKVLGSNNTGTTTNLISGLIFAVDNGAKVINLSVGGPDTSAKYDAVLYAYNAGVTIAACTMNHGAELIYYVAGYKEVIAVGATDNNDNRASFSNYGRHIDVVAPGQGIYSTYTSNPYYTNMSGTSMATPHVSGLAALILSINPSFNPDQVKWHIENGADDQVGNISEDTPGWDKYYGWGRINAYNALQSISPGLTFSLESTYANSSNKGVRPSSGNITTIFTYKIIYFDDNNLPPSFVHVCIDGNCNNMTSDTSAASILRDGNYVNGEQYIYTTTLSLGSHNYFFNASNGSNSKRLPLSESFSGPIVSDTQAPTGTIRINDNANFTNTTAVVLTLTCNDAGGSGCSQMHFSNDNVTWSDPEDFATTKNWDISSGDGTKTVYVKYRDGAGNWSNYYFDTIILDTTYPVTSASPVGGSYSTGQSVTLSCDDDGGSGCNKIYYTINGSTPTIDSTVYSIPINIASSTTLKFFAQDFAANNEPVKTEVYTIIIDTSPPLGSININSGASYTNSLSVSLSLSCSDVSGCSQMCISNSSSCSSWETYAASKSWDLISGDGNKTVYARFRDGVGNSNTSPYSDSILLDTTAPTTTTSPTGGTYSSTQNITLTCNDASGSGCQATYYCTGAGCDPATVYSGAINVSSSTVLRFYSKDNANNSESIKTVTYTITTADTIPPTTTASPAGGTFTSAQSVTLSCNDGGGSGCQITRFCLGIGCTPSTPYSGAINISSSNTLRFYSTDIDNNNESVKSETYTINLPGQNERVDLDNNIYIIFSQVSDLCNSSSSLLADSPGSPPSGYTFIGNFYDITTCATYTGTITITIPYNESLAGGREGSLRIFHWESGRWVDVTVSVNTVNNTITGRVNSLSPFGIGYYSGGGGGYSTGANTSLIALLAMIAISGGFLLLRRQRGIS